MSVHSWSKKFLHFPFSPSLCIEHLLEQLEDNLKGSLGLSQVLMLVLLWTQTTFQKSILAAIFRCTQRGESLIIPVKCVSTFHYGSYPGQEQSFWWLGYLGSTFLLRAVYLIFFVGVVHMYSFLFFHLFEF